MVYQQPADVGAARDALAKAGYQATVAEFGSNRELQVRVRINDDVDPQQLSDDVMKVLTTVDPSVVLLGRETILRNGKQVGYLTSGGYGYTVGKPIGYGYIRDSTGVDDGYVRSGTYELVVANNLVKARAHLGPLYDPENLRVKS